MRLLNCYVNIFSHPFLDSLDVQITSLVKIFFLKRKKKNRGVVKNLDVLHNVRVQIECASKSPLSLIHYLKMKLIWFVVTRFRKSDAKSLEVEIPISLRSRGCFRGDFQLESFTRLSFLTLKIAKASSGYNKTISERRAKGAALECICTVNVSIFSPLS